MMNLKKFTIYRKHTYKIMKAINEGVNKLNDTTKYLDTPFCSTVYSKISKLVDMGLVEKKQIDGKIKKPILTEKGKKIYKNLENIAKIQENCPNPYKKSKSL